MKKVLQIFPFLGLGAAAACADNPVLSPDAHGDEIDGGNGHHEVEFAVPVDESH